MAQPTGLACPQCASLTGETVHLMAGPTSISCGKGHFFTDTAALMALNPTKIHVPQKVSQQENQVELRLTLPSRLHDALAARFGAKLNASAAAILEALVQPSSFVVNGTDAARLADKLGAKSVTNAGELFGLVYNLSSEKSQLSAKLEDMHVRLDTMKKGVTGVIVPTLPAAGYNVEVSAMAEERLTELAKFQGVTVEKVIADTIQFATENKWI